MRTDRQELLGAVNVELGVVGLALLLVSGLGPGVEAPASRGLVGRGHLLAVGRPEPPEDGLGLQVTAVFTALEVTQATRRPDVGHVICDQIVCLLKTVLARKK